MYDVRSIFEVVSLFYWNCKYKLYKKKIEVEQVKSAPLHSSSIIGPRDDSTLFQLDVQYQKLF